MKSAVSFRFGVVGLVALGFCAFAIRSNAATSDNIVTYHLSLNDNGHGYAAGNFAVYLSDSTNANNNGIVGFVLNVGNATTLNNVAPQAFYDDGSGEPIQEAFTFMRTLTGNLVFGSQDTISGGAVRFVTGLGQIAGNLDAFAPAGSTRSNAVQVNYGANLLVATGTYSAAAPVYFAGADASAHPFDDANVFDFTKPGHASAATVVHETQTLFPNGVSAIPEPATAATGLCALVFLRRQRRNSN